MAGNTSTFAKDKNQSTLENKPLVDESLDLLLQIERRITEGDKRNLIYYEDILDYLPDTFTASYFWYGLVLQYWF